METAASEYALARRAFRRAFPTRSHDAATVYATLRAEGMSARRALDWAYATTLVGVGYLLVRRPARKGGR